MSTGSARPENWAETAAALQRIQDSQLFFLGGAPRSGTTWLQQMLDAHPDASCRGEGLFAKLLFPLLDAYIGRWRMELSEKNQAVFSQMEGYPLPGEEERRFLAASTILLALRRQSEGQNMLAYGEKTPENVFFFPKLADLFPQAKFIAIARDPRDVITSAWHFFHPRMNGPQAETAKLAFIRSTMTPLADGMRSMIAHEQAFPGRCHNVTYERLHRDPETSLGALFRFLSLPDAPEVVADCVRRTRFETMTGDRKAGDGQDGTFLRKGITGDWPSTLTPAMNDLVLEKLGWAFPYFGWTP